MCVSVEEGCGCVSDEKGGFMFFFFPLDYCWVSLFFILSVRLMQRPCACVVCFVCVYVCSVCMYVYVCSVFRTCD